jgi:hypothetical protein
LVIVWVTGTGGTTTPTVTCPGGGATYALAGTTQTGTSCVAALFWGIVTGANAAPTVSAATGMTWNGIHAEFSGNASSSLVDQPGGANGLTSTQVATAAGADAQAGELVCAAAATVYSKAATSANSFAFNNGATASDIDDDTQTVANHCTTSYGITTGNSAADTATFTFTTTKVTGVAVKLVSFALPGGAPPAVIPELVTAPLTHY